MNRSQLEHIIRAAGSIADDNEIILGDADAVIEIKSSETVGDRTKGLHLFLEEKKWRKAFIVSKEPLPRKLATNITVLPWKRFCEMLWAGENI